MILPNLKYKLLIMICPSRALYMGMLWCAVEGARIRGGAIAALIAKTTGTEATCGVQ